MARDDKVVLTPGGLDRRESGYYSTPAPVAAYLAKRLLALRPKAKTVLDPCIGAQEMAAPFLARGLAVLGYDIHQHLPQYSAQFLLRDFLSVHSAWQRGTLLPLGFETPDLIILNPPYNCHEVDYIKTRKTVLRAQFAQTGAYNMYSMFLDAVIDMAPPGGIIGAIVADSFLTAKFHTKLRRKVAQECIVHDVILCPTDLFQDQNADVRTCILVLEKGTAKPGHKIRSLQRPARAKDLFARLDSKRFADVSQNSVFLADETDGHEIVVGVPADVRALFFQDRLGSRYPCVTGISTGDNSKHLRADPEPGFGLPFYKNPGMRKFNAPPNAYLVDDPVQAATKFTGFVLRNPTFLGKEGITCSSMGVRFSACHLPAGAAFGVNPNVFAGADNWWLMAYLNSKLVLYLLRGVLIRGNMVNAGYVARLPLVQFSEAQRTRLAELARQGYAVTQDGQASILAEIDRITFAAADLSPSSQDMIEQFCTDVVRAS